MHSKRRDPKNRARGFTLIEVMLATAFFLAVLSAILNLQVKSAQMLQSSRHFEHGVNLLNDMGELLQVLPTDKVQELVSNKAGTAFAEDGAPLEQAAANAFFRLYVDLVPGVATFKQLNLQVQWQEQAEKRSVFSNLLVNLP